MVFDSNTSACHVLHQTLSMLQGYKWYPVLKKFTGTKTKIKILTYQRDNTNMYNMDEELG